MESVLFRVVSVVQLANQGRLRLQHPLELRMLLIGHPSRVFNACPLGHQLRSVTRAHASVRLGDMYQLVQAHDRNRVTLMINPASQIRSLACGDKQTRAN
jgi:hypothetical protein